MRRIAAITAILVFAVSANIGVAQQAEESMLVSLNYVTVKPGMNAAFLAALADHLEWHRSTNDTHYYDTWQVVSGPRTGQYMWSVGPVTGDQLDDYDAFGPEDMGDWGSRGGMSLVERVETIVMATMPGFGNPPPADAELPPLVHVWEIELEAEAIGSFTEALGRMDEIQSAVGDVDYVAWLMPISGIGFTQRWFVHWTDGWGDAMPDPEREARVMEEAGGPEAMAELMGELAGAIDETGSTSYRLLPELSFRPGQ